MYRIAGLSVNKIKMIRHNTTERQGYGLDRQRRRLAAKGKFRITLERACVVAEGRAAMIEEHASTTSANSSVLFRIAFFAPGAQKDLYRRTIEG